MTHKSTFDLDAVQKTIRDRIGEAIGSSGLPSHKAAGMSGYSPAHLRRLRNGEGKNPTIAGIWSLAEAMNVNPHWLLGSPYVTKYTGIEDPQERKSVLTSEVIDEASRLFHVHPRDITGPYRYQFLMPVRFALYHSFRERGLSYPHIGRIMNRDHSSVIYGAQQAVCRMERDAEYAEKVEQLIKFRPKIESKELEHG